MFILRLLVIMANNSYHLLSCNLIPGTIPSALHRLVLCERGSVSPRFVKHHANPVLAPFPRNLLGCR